MGKLTSSKRNNNNDNVVEADPEPEIQENMNENENFQDALPEENFENLQENLKTNAHPTNRTPRQAS